MTSANSLNRRLLGREREGHINPELPAYFHSPKPAYHYPMLIIIRGLEELTNDISGDLEVPAYFHSPKPAYHYQRP